MERDVTQRFHQGADTSIQAHQETPTLVRIRQREHILRIIEGRGRDGATCQELEIQLGMSHESCSARITELHHKFKLIEDSGRRRHTTSGRKARVYVKAPPSGQRSLF